MAQEPLGHDKGDLLARLDASFAELKAAIPSPSFLTSSTRADWGPFESLAHLTGWHLLSASRLRQIAAGQAPDNPGAADEMNARFVAERKSVSGATLLADLQRSFDEMRAAAESVPDAAYWRGKDGEEDSLAYFIVSANGPEHYAEHMTDLRGAGRGAETDRRGRNFIPEPLGKAQLMTEETAQRLLHAIEHSQPVRTLRASQWLSGFLGAVGFALFVVGIENAAQDFPVVSDPYGSIVAGIILLALTGLLLRQLTEGK